MLVHTITFSLSVRPLNRHSKQHMLVHTITFSLSVRPLNHLSEDERLHLANLQVHIQPRYKTLFLIMLMSNHFVCYYIGLYKLYIIHPIFFVNTSRNTWCLSDSYLPLKLLITTIIAFNLLLGMKCVSKHRRLGAKGSYLTLVRLADRIL